MTKENEYKKTLEETLQLLCEMDNLKILLKEAQSKYEQIQNNINKCKQILTEGTPTIKILKKEDNKLILEETSYEEL